MAAIKFSKQYVDPNPNEVDYWIDLTSNPYGGKIKYNNGIDWVDLIGSNGSAVDFDNYFNKDQINEMLANKASVDSVESKVDDTEIAEIIKNIEIKDRGNSGVELVLLKYNDTTIGVTMPIASSTTSGVVTSDDFKNLVKQYKLQEFYTEMYEKLADIRNSYQPKLKAGKNITIDKTTNTIHATGKLSTEWKDLINVPDFKPVATSGDYNDLINKPDETIQDIKSTLNKEIQDRKDAVTTEINDRINAVKTEETRAIIKENELSTRIDNHFAITDALIESKADKSDTYTKNQIDQKLSGVYRIKGSCSFEQLPLTGNTAGDVYIITNAFTLNGVEYSAGTNVVYTENGWIALSGMFDMTELENAIQNVSINLTNEIVRATEAEQLNATNITNIDNRLKNAEESLNIINGDELTTGSIAKVIKDTKDHTDSSVTTEKNRATEAENKIASDLSTAKTDIHNQISSINETLSTEISAREASDTTISTNLTNEINRATTRENKIEQDYIASVQGLQFNINVVDGKLVNYLPLSGGTLSGTSGEIFRIDRTNENTAYVSFWNNKVIRGYLGVNPSGEPVFANKGGTVFKIWHEGNFTPSNYLPLSGGTLTGALTVNSDLGVGGLIVNRGHYLFARDNDNADWIVTNKNWLDEYKLWHSGNDGSGSGLDADLLDGKHNGELTAQYFSQGKLLTKADTINKLMSGVYCYINGDNPTGSIGNNAILLSFRIYGRNDMFQIISEGNNKTLHYRCSTNISNLYEQWGEWKLIAFTDSNVASATKLQTARTIWGQSFDGTGNIENNDIILYKNPSESLYGWSIGIHAKDSTGKTLLQIGVYGYADNYNYTFIGRSYDDTAMVVTADDKVGIGTKTPSSKLHVNGVLTLPLNNQVQWSDSGGAMIYGTAGKKIIIDSSVVGIGTTNPSLSYKLDVRGNVSGDFVDWYGVSWSENSSDPTCTRIGNMAMHKSLPILSAMKGYYIEGAPATNGESILPLQEENWPYVKYDFESNNTIQASPNWAGNIMVKIPEFWYIDDYEPSTKTHNLKISQTAKAGWLHHKEAYVGAYEGYNNGNRYKSIKGKIPTVSITRTDLRPLARANGYKDEYKWNIYTYEEHRAICHLFLVEYATRNSQAPVNTALTADGFKQGGLGSGCTTGLINDEYSFIPTGTTDSLGNGSGQVAYTASNGVTYYANRYRGIENPFGHIWKHVDDVITKYDANNTYRTVYKCNKPEHFETNKNTKYKPLCSFPGGTKMQGWSKEIKATINCDFFKYSVGGSESTYWCDYNYDNDDTSEHCLLIGGDSGSGGSQAGLFCFALHCGVGDSYVGIGSRLTYLPWAE